MGERSRRKRRMEAFSEGGQGPETGCSTIERMDSITDVLILVS
jgi:hypothetical protein